MLLGCSRPWPPAVVVRPPSRLLAQFCLQRATGPDAEDDDVGDGAQEREGGKGLDSEVPWGIAVHREAGIRGDERGAFDDAPSADEGVQSLGVDGHKLRATAMLRVHAAPTHPDSANAVFVRAVTYCTPLSRAMTSENWPARSGSPPCGKGGSHRRRCRPNPTHVELGWPAPSHEREVTISYLYIGPLRVPTTRVQSVCRRSGPRPAGKACGDPARLAKHPQRREATAGLASAGAGSGSQALG